MTRKQLAGRAALLVQFVACESFALLCLYLGLTASAALAAIWGAVFTPRSMTIRWRWTALTLAATMSGAIFRVLPLQVQVRQDELWARVVAGGPAALDPLECLGIYLFGLIMASGGLISGYPEAAEEHFLLHIPGGADRYFHSAFPLESAKIRAALARFASSGKPALAATRVVFKATDPEPRGVVYALNPLSLSARREAHKVVARGEVAVRYPARARTELAAFGMRFFVEEGLFAALQERGWLFPYRAIWVFEYKPRR